MIPEFLVAAALAGLGVALMAGPLGTLVVWRRLAYFGDTLAHGALMGAALGVALEISPRLAVAAASLALALAQVAALLAASDARIATLAQPIGSADQVFDPNCVKVVRRDDGDALYFSRAPVPYDRDGFARNRLKLGDHGWLRHIGLYAYRVGDLCRFSALPAARLERCEALEQLRALQAGWRVAVGVFDQAFPAGVDTEADLERVDQLLRSAAAAEPNR